MNGKNLMLAAFEGRRTEHVPVAPHVLLVYKQQLVSTIHGSENQILDWESHPAQSYADFESLYYEYYRPDMFQLGEGAWKNQPGDAERERAKRELGPAVKELISKEAIDEYIDAVYPSEYEIESAGIYDHVPILAERYGEDALILLNEGNPVSHVIEDGGPAGDFKDALIATIEHPDNLAYLIWRLYEKKLVKLRVLKRKGAHGYIGSECNVSCDILSPSSAKALVFPALRRFYTEAAQIGLIPVVYFTGEIFPIIDDIASLGAKALMIEEPKKAYRLDAVEIHRRLAGRMALFGNLDSVYQLLYGTPETVAAETRRQCECARTGGFIMSCGSPLCQDTPAENIRAMIDTARSFAL